jgi:hypothetical protein
VLTVSRKPGDNRLWLGSPDDLSTFRGQRGGVGTIDKMLDEWRAKLELDPAMLELYGALSGWLPRSAREVASDEGRSCGQVCGQPLPQTAGPGRVGSEPAA